MTRTPASGVVGERGAGDQVHPLIIMPSLSAPSPYSTASPPPPSAPNPSPQGGLEDELQRLHQSLEERAMEAVSSAQVWWFRRG